MIISTARAARNAQTVHTAVTEMIVWTAQKYGIAQTAKTIKESTINLKKGGGTNRVEIENVMEFEKSTEAVKCLE